MKIVATFNKGNVEALQANMIVNSQLINNGHMVLHTAQKRMRWFRTMHTLYTVEPCVLYHTWFQNNKRIQSFHLESLAEARIRLGFLMVSDGG